MHQEPFFSFFFFNPFPCVFLHEELGFQKQASSLEACPEQKLLLLHLSLFAWGWEEPLGSRWELESSLSPCCFSSKPLQSHHPSPPPPYCWGWKQGQVLWRAIWAELILLASCPKSLCLAAPLACSAGAGGHCGSFTRGPAETMVMGGGLKSRKVLATFPNALFLQGVQHSCSLISLDHCKPLLRDAINSASCGAHWGSTSPLLVLYLPWQWSCAAFNFCF